MKNKTKINEKIRSFWCKKGPWKIGRIAIYTNGESGWRMPVAATLWAQNKGPLWGKWGAIYFGVRVLWFWLRFRVATGTKTAVIPRWMM